MPTKEEIALYYSEIEPSYRLLKEILVQQGFKQIQAILKQEIVNSGLDSYFIKDAAEFLRLSVLDLLAYKFLMSGNYLAWGEVTLYYSNFYSINCLLRLGGFAISHLDFIDEGQKVLRIERIDWKNHYYKFNECKKISHQYFWNKFSEYYPRTGFTPDLGKLLHDERVRWNYDLFYPSQSMSDYAIKEARTRWENNFLSPTYGHFDDPDAVEYFHSLMADFGYEEVGSGQLIENCLDYFTEIAKSSKFKSWYMSFFSEIADGINSFSSHDSMKNEIKSWLMIRMNDLEST